MGLVQKGLEKWLRKFSWNSDSMATTWPGSSLPRWRKAPDWRRASCGIELKESAVLKRYGVGAIHENGIRTEQKKRCKQTVEKPGIPGCSKRSRCEARIDRDRVRET